VKSSGLVYGSTREDPQWFKEETPRSRAPRTRVERSLIEVEGYLRDFAEDNPHVTVSLLRFANVLGPDIETSITKALNLPVAPSILGFDPMLQFVEEDDVVRSIEFAIHNDLAGIFNVAADGRLPWSEVAAICNRRLFPVPPVMTELLTSPLARLGILDLGPETIDLLRYGRGHDNRRFKQAGFKYRYTSAGAVEAFARAQRLRASVGGGKQPYRYEQEVEAFFKHSPSVVRTD
jgi:UDP-glucose 4-epimerase